MTKSKKKNDCDWIHDTFSEDIAKAVFKLHLTLPNGQTIDRDFTPDINIDPEMLNEQMKELPAIYAFYSVAWAEQKAQVAMLSRTIKRRRGKIVEKLRKSAGEGNQSVRITDRALIELIESDNSLLELNSKLILAEKIESKLYGVVSSLRMKAEMMRTLAADKREELRTN